MINVHPHLYKQLGETQGVHFRILTNARLKEVFHIDDASRYESTGVISFDHDADVARMLQVSGLPRPLHILVVAPDSGFTSPVPEVLGTTCKLLVLPCNSSDITIDDIQHYLFAMEKTDVVSQKEWSNNFFRLGESAKFLMFADAEMNTSARFNHLTNGYEWFEQLGPIDWGGQQFCPAGEISVLPMFHGNFDHSKRLDISGEIALRGIPIVNSGSPSYLREDQERIYSELAHLRNSTVIASVNGGVISSLKTSDLAGERVKKMLECLFTVDSRYRIIWEIGIGSNTDMEPLAANRTPNESFGSEQGCVHWGLGLTPWTQFHIDVLCPGTVVSTDTGIWMAGGRRQIIRKNSAGCPCIMDQSISGQQI